MREGVGAGRVVGHRGCSFLWLGYKETHPQCQPEVCTQSCSMGPRKRISYLGIARMEGGIFKEEVIRIHTLQRNSDERMMSFEIVCKISGI